MRLGAPARRELSEDGGGGHRRLTLRVSLLDRCQYQCPYCRPGTLEPFFDPSVLLPASAYARLAPIFVEMGVRKVRFTGGEPLLRRDVVDVIGAFARASAELDLALTTNGQLLPGRARELAAAGLARATVHVDSLRPDRYRELMGRGDVAAILEGALAARAELAEVKLNAVIQRGRNDDEILDFIEYSAKNRIEVRFIELMNTGSAVDYTREVFFSGREIVDVVRRAHGVTPAPRRHASDPAALWTTDHGVTFGVIASDTEPFCSACDRLRLTADGDLRGCLYQGSGEPLRDVVASGSDEELRAAVRRAIQGKRSFHPAVAPRRLLFSMARTGG